MIQTLEDMIRKCCAYGLEFKDTDGFTHDWCTLIQALELAYKISVHSSTGQTPAMLEKGWNPRLPDDTPTKDLTDIHPTASRFKIMLDKVKNHAKTTWMMLLNMKNNSGTRVIKYKELKDSYVGPFFIASLHGNNAVQLELSGELENKPPTCQVSLIKAYQLADKELFSLRNPTPLTIPPVEQSEEKRIKKVIKDRRLRVKIKENILSDIEIH
ncbi:hypothetical protein O181_039363 [Austropuccinia psidii MF-1]|uniref:Integrase catalytic domain-containing protein n=1 Tax=Austropuccinia psidii MF-1 TaxID=1389203 RepID=A0A9Q3DF76_9BASI|nr:hypothetical protein [Austropuccinia psidii MF-1]